MQGVRSSEVATGADPGSGERELQALGFPAVSVESFPSSPTDGSRTELPSLDFPFTGATWAPFHLLGKQREVRSGILELPHPKVGKLRSRTQSKTEAFPTFSKIPQMSWGKSGMTQPPQGGQHL